MSALRIIESVEDLFDRRGEEGVRDELVEHYLPLAEGLARRYRHCGQPMEDLVQAACIGLLKAIDRFESSRGVAFESYVVPTILGELKRYHRDRGWSVRMPRQLQERALAVKDGVSELSQELGRSPTLSEIAKHTRLSEEEVREGLRAQDAYTSLSLDTPLSDDGETITLGSLIAAEDGALELVEEWVECVSQLRCLPEREQKLIRLRFFEDHTQSEIAKELGVSQMHVSRLLSHTIASLREALGAA